MTKSAILFGSIGTLVETSELQREAFNQAFREAGLDWAWEPEEYRQLLKKSGGRQRIANYAKDRGEEVDADAIHKRKTEIFDAAMIENGLDPRPGVLEVIKKAKDEGVKLGFVTSTSRANIDAILAALGDQIKANTFDFIGDASLVSSSKPSPDIYKTALGHLGLSPEECIAIEDMAVSAEAPRAAGIETVAFPGPFAERDEFRDVRAITDTLEYAELISSD